jgi:hypothetical protein
MKPVSTELTTKFSDRTGNIWTHLLGLAIYSSMVYKFYEELEEETFATKLNFIVAATASQYTLLAR